MERIRNKSFVQIGSSIGFDNFKSLCDQYKPSEIILVEPIESSHVSLRSCYDGYNYTIEKLAIVDSDIKSVDLYSPGGSQNSAHWSVIGHLDWDKRSQKIDGKEYSVDAIRIGELFDKHSLVDIGLLYIDTEGNDARIINDIDFTKYSIDIIVWEFWGFTQDYFEEYNILNGLDGMNYIKNKLTDIGYSISEYNGSRQDFIAIKNY